MFIFLSGFVYVFCLQFTGGSDWTPHKVELTVWTHYILKDLKPELLSEMKTTSAPVPAAEPAQPAPETPSAEPAPAAPAAEKDTNGSVEAENKVSPLSFKLVKKMFIYLPPFQDENTSSSIESEDSSAAAKNDEPASAENGSEEEKTSASPEVSNQ